jgi:hypothetical protein
MGPFPTATSVIEGVRQWSLRGWSPDGRSTNLGKGAWFALLSAKCLSELDLVLIYTVTLAPWQSGK